MRTHLETYEIRESGLLARRGTAEAEESTALKTVTKQRLTNTEQTEKTKECQGEF
jgi:hypothetical protein